MWLDRIKEFEKKESDKYSDREKRLKELNEKYPEINKGMLFGFMIWTIGAALLIFAFMAASLYMDSFDLIHMDIFVILIFLSVSLLTAWMGYYQSKHPMFYDEVRNINNIQLKPKHMYLLAILIFLLGFVLFIPY